MKLLLAIALDCILAVPVRAEDKKEAPKKEEKTEKAKDKRIEAHGPKIIDAN